MENSMSASSNMMTVYCFCTNYNIKFTQITFQVAVFLKIRQEVICECQKPTEFSFISCSKTVIDHITSLSFSFQRCAFVIKFKQIVLEISTLQQLSFSIWLKLVEILCLMNIRCQGKKNTRIFQQVFLSAMILKI